MDYVFPFDGGEPLFYQDVLEDCHEEKWVVSIKEYMGSLIKNNIYELVERSKGSKLKYEDEWSDPRYMERSRELGRIWGLFMMKFSLGW